jgi:glycosyltransferase involved in cell wall biosynthesis
MRGRAFTIPHGVDERLFDIARNDDRPTADAILFLARIAPKKGLDIVLKALYILRERGVNARLTVAGSGDPRYQRRITALVKKLDLNRWVEFLGHVDEVARAALLSSHDVFVLPSRDENFGIAVAEALAAGLPVVITPGVALSEYVAGNASGFVVNRDPKSVASGIATILAEESNRRHRRNSATALAKRHFRWDVAGRLMEQMYLECIRGRTP